MPWCRQCHLYSKRLAMPVFVGVYPDLCRVWYVFSKLGTGYALFNASTTNRKGYTMSQSNQYFIYSAKLLKIKVKPLTYAQWLSLAAALARSA
jgi:hypothetical protein